MRAQFRRPTAFLPLAMSLAALALVLCHAAIYGVVHEADEGAAAHTFQPLMAGQAPLVLYFALRWLPRDPSGSVPVLALQCAAAGAAFASVYFLT